MPMGEGAVTAAAPAEAWADEREPAQKPEEPSLSAGEWLSRNLFSSAVNSVLTVVFTLLVLLAVRGLLNFTFSEERTWRAVKTNMRFLFTHAYPQEQYVRIWVCVGAIAVLSGLSIGLLAKTGRGISLKKLSMNLMGSGALIALGILLREPSAVVGDEGAVLHRDAAGAAGYRFAGSQGGRSTFVRSDESVVVMALDPDRRRFRYIVLATNRIGTMERELNEVPPEFDIVGITAFREWLEGGAVILEAEDTARRQDAVP